jgi:hypothetical protein
LTMSHDLDVPRRAAAVAPAQNATSEDRFVKSSRSFDVGDGEKVRDGVTHPAAASDSFSARLLLGS